MHVGTGLIVGALAAASPAAVAAPPNMLVSVNVDPQTFAMLLSGLLFAGIMLRRGP